MRSGSATALSRRPASSQVSLARCIGLQRTSANSLAASTGRIRFASRRPLSVSGMSVVPVCWPLRLHAVSPCLIATTFTFASRSNVVAFRRRLSSSGSGLLTPPPARDLGHVVTVTRDVLLVVNELAAHRLLGVRRTRTQLRHAVDDVADQVEAIHVVQHAHVKRCRGGALFLVAANVYVPVAVSPVGQPMDQRGVAVERKD